MAETQKTYIALSLGALTLAIALGIGVVAFQQAQTVASFVRIDNRLDIIYSDVGTMKADVAVVMEKISRIEPIINRIDKRVAGISSTTKDLGAYMVNREAKDYSQKRLLEMVRELPKDMEIILVPKPTKSTEIPKAVPMPALDKKYKFISPSTDWKYIPYKGSEKTMKEIMKRNVK
jgi:hypothetical protein